MPCMYIDLILHRGIFYTLTKNMFFSVLLQGRCPSLLKHQTKKEYRRLVSCLIMPVRNKQPEKRSQAPWRSETARF